MSAKGPYGHFDISTGPGVLLTTLGYPLSLVLDVVGVLGDSDTNRTENGPTDVS